MQPTRKQKVLLDKHFGCVRFVYNHFLNERKEQYQSDKKSDNYYIQASILTQLKKNNETVWLKEVNSQSLQFALRCLDTAYINFFRGNANFPKFKSKKNKNTFTVPQFAKLGVDRFYIPKFKEGIKVNAHRKVKGDIRKCTLSKTPTGKYFVSILSEEQYKPKEKTGNICGIDLGLKDFAVTSDGIKFRNNKYTKQYERKLKKAQQYLSRKIIGSNSFERQRRKVSLIHEKITNSRMDNLHKVSHQLISNYDIIALEDLDIKKMVRNHKFAKHISDTGWGTFVKLLEYKAYWNDKKIIKINRFYPSSKTCHECGWINQDLNLSMREWTCGNGHIIDRDLNAAKNILKEGLKILSSGTGDYTDRDGVRSINAQLSMKSGV
ncbi:MAG: transposase [Bacteroidales bacterium]|nr:transposase [Bacteroidales bacterium]